MFPFRRKADLRDETIANLTWELDAARALNLALDAENERLIADNAKFTAEAEAVVAMTTAMREAHHRQTDGLNDIIRGLNKALSLKQAEVDKALAEVKRLDGKLVQAGVDLGQERDDHRALRQRWARHLNSCTVADDIDAEDAAKARTR